MHEGSGEITGLPVQGVRVRGVLVVEGLLRPAGEGVLGGEVTGGFSRHGVLVVPGCRVCDRLCKPRKKTKKQKNLNSRVHFLNFIYEEQLSPTAVFDFVGERRGLRDAHMASSVMTPTAPLCLAGFNGSGTRASL